MDYTVHGILQTRILEWVAFAFSFSRGSSQPRDWTQVSCLAGGFFTSWATGKPKNTGLGSLSLLQQIFPMQGSNPGLPHCRRIIYQLSVIIYCRSSWKLIKPDFWEHPGHIPGTIRKASWYLLFRNVIYLSLNQCIQSLSGNYLPIQLYIHFSSAFHGPPFGYLASGQ